MCTIYHQLASTTFSCHVDGPPSTNSALIHANGVHPSPAADAITSTLPLNPSPTSVTASPEQGIKPMFMQTFPEQFLQYAPAMMGHYPGYYQNPYSYNGQQNQYLDPQTMHRPQQVYTEFKPVRYPQQQLPYPLVSQAPQQRLPYPLQSPDFLSQSSSYHPESSMPALCNSSPTVLNAADSSTDHLSALCSPPSTNSYLAAPTNTETYRYSGVAPSFVNKKTAFSSESQYPPVLVKGGGKIKSKPVRRTEFSAESLRILEHHFAASDFARGTRRDQIARQLNVKPRSVTIWFQNKRAKLRARSQQLDLMKKAAETGVVQDLEKLADFR